MRIQISMWTSAAALAAALMTLGACSGAEADKDGDTAAAATKEAAEKPSAKGDDEAKATKVAAKDEAADEGLGPDDFEETVKTARCKIYDPGGEYEGPCQFTQWGGASFMVSRKDGSEFFNGITEVSVEVDAPGVAGGSVRQEGENNFIGTMERHKDDKACWSSADFTVCAY